MCPTVFCSVRAGCLCFITRSGCCVSMDPEKRFTYQNVKEGNRNRRQTLDFYEDCLIKSEKKRAWLTKSPRGRKPDFSAFLLTPLDEISFFGSGVLREGRCAPPDSAGREGAHIPAPVRGVEFGRCASRPIFALSRICRRSEERVPYRSSDGTRKVFLRWWSRMSSIELVALPFSSSLSPIINSSASPYIILLIRVFVCVCVCAPMSHGLHSRRFARGGYEHPPAALRSKPERDPEITSHFQILTSDTQLTSAIPLCELHRNKESINKRSVIHPRTENQTSNVMQAPTLSQTVTNYNRIIDL